MDSQDPGLDFYNQAESGTRWQLDIQLVNAAGGVDCPASFPTEIAQVPNTAGVDPDLEFQLNRVDESGDITTNYAHVTSATLTQMVNGAPFDCTIDDATIQPGICVWNRSPYCKYSFTALPAK